MRSLACKADLTPADLSTPAGISIRGHTTMRWNLRTSLFALLGATWLLPVTAASARDVVIHAGTLIDGVSASARQQVSIVVRGNRILAVQPGFIAPEGADVVDLSRQTVLPGFIDMHDHATDKPDEGAAGRFTRSDAQAGIWAVINARRDIETGFTSVRDVGSEGTAVPVLRAAIEANAAIGPRFWSALEELSPTGGHADPMNGPPTRLIFSDRPYYVVDGAEAMRIAVREHHRRGANVIKLMVSGGVGSVEDDPSLLLMTDEEMRVAVETAHSLGMKVAAHAHGKKAVDQAVRAGVDSIEHGTFADAESYELMRQHGTFLVPTLLVADELLKTATQHPERLPPTVADKARRVLPLMSDNAGRAYRAGVKIAFGTDVSSSSDRNKAEEFELLARAGLRPMDALFAATRNAAELLGASQDVGSIQPGRYADIVAVNGDPLADMKILQSVDFVMKGGEVVKAQGNLVKDLAAHAALAH
jgi:imidazolonepropionase-like amidohydrolase